MVDYILRKRHFVKGGPPDLGVEGFDHRRQDIERVYSSWVVFVVGGELGQVSFWSVG
jgi:hypothetical protein